MKLNLKELVKLLSQKPKECYTVAVIDNSPPMEPKLPVVKPNFLWIEEEMIKEKGIRLPASREKLIKLFSSYGVKIRDKIAIFHHHNVYVRKPYFRSSDDVEYYEFSHCSSFSYKCFKHGDADMLSHMLSRSFHYVDEIILQTGLKDDEIIELQRKFWYINLEKKKNEVDLESQIIHELALEMGPHKVIPDPKRYRPEDHDELIEEAGLYVDQYAIPALFKRISTHTGNVLDKKVKEITKRLEADWKEAVKKKRQRRAAIQALEADLKEAVKKKRR